MIPVVAFDSWQYSAVQYSTVQYSTVKYSILSLSSSQEFEAPKGVLDMHMVTTNNQKVQGWFRGIFATVSTGTQSQQAIDIFLQYSTVQISI